MRSGAALLFLLAVVAGAGAASALDLKKKPPVVAGAGSALDLKKKPPVVDVVLPADPRGLTLGRFAALVYSLNRNVRLTCTGVSGVEQVPDKSGRGVTYQLVITVTDAGGNTYTYRVVVWGIRNTTQWMLLQFQRIN